MDRRHHIGVVLCLASVVSVAACGNTPAASAVGATSNVSPSPAATATATSTATLVSSPTNVGAPAGIGDRTAGWDPVSRRVIVQVWASDMSSPPTTWAWDGQQWVQLIPQHQLPSQREASMAVDPMSGRLLLMGGISLTNQTASHGPQWGPNDGTWLWTGSDWSRVADNPRQGGHPALAIDEATGQLVVNCPQILGVETPSGIDPGQPTLPSPAPSWTGDGSFRWTGSGWVAVAGSAPLLLDSGVGYDPISRRVIQFGGTSQSADNQTAAYDDQSWTVLHPAHTPPPGAAVAATDVGSRDLLLVAASLDHPTLATTWTWNGSDWIRQIVNEPPATVVGGFVLGTAQMLWDPAVNRVVLIGNGVGATSTLRVWIWQGADQGWNLLGS